MRFSDLLAGVIHSLRAHKVRTMLTMFGIAWGVLSVTLMVAAGEGLRRGQAKQAETMGKDLIILWAGRTSLQAGGERAGRQLHFFDADEEPLKREAFDCRTIMPEFARTVQARSNFNNASLTVSGSRPPYDEFRSLTVAEGRFYTNAEADEGRRVVFLGSDVRRQLFAGRNAVGETIRLDNIPYLVIGVMAQKEQNSDYNGRDVQKMFAPLGAVVRDFPEPPPSLPHQLDNLLVVPRSVEKHDSCLAQAKRTLARIHGFDPNDEDALPMWDTFKEAKAFRQLTDGMKQFLGAVGFVTLLLGGIGVMNVMLVAVRERTREIGIRKAVGATRGSIVAQFFAEALFITGASGVIGMGLAWGLCTAVNQLEMPQFFDGLIADWQVSMWSMGCLAIIGMLAALYPAIKAASVDPIEALRQEAGG
jgi:putative ABC transport system permease protein